MKREMKIEIINLIVLIILGIVVATMSNLRIIHIIIEIIIIILVILSSIKLIKLRKIIQREKKELDCKSAEYYKKIMGITAKEDFFEKVKRMILKSKITRKSLVILVVSLENIRDISNTYGHKISDKVLIEVCRIFHSELGENVIFNTFGSDEFIIAIPNVENIDMTKEKINYMLAKIKDDIDIDGKSISCNFSAGISVSPEDSDQLDLLLKGATMAKEKAKNSGKNKCITFDHSILEKMNRCIEIERCLKNAINENEVFLVLQPKVVLKSGNIHGFEALLRWNSKELGFVSPAEFIPVAEETGVILELGDFILEEAFRQCKELTLNSKEKFNVAINISEVQLRNEKFIEQVALLLERYQLNPRYIEFEITEGVIMKSVARNISILLKLKELGFSVALDDFGTGYSSMNYLRRLPIDVLKIDKSFIDGIGVDEKGEKIAESIIELSHNLDLTVVAEGVETKEQLVYLSSMNCDIIQGYYYSKPETFDVAKDMIKNNKKF